MRRLSSEQVLKLHDALQEEFGVLRESEIKDFWTLH
mgnify:CR=1 FL=1